MGTKKHKGKVGEKSGAVELKSLESNSDNISEIEPGLNASNDQQPKDDKSVSSDGEGPNSGKINQKARPNHCIRIAIIGFFVVLILVGSLVAVMLVIGTNCDDRYMEQDTELNL